jgi:hypothetical protein
MGSLPKAKAGVGSAVNDTTRQAGGALGVAVIGSVFAARYHAAVDVPDAIPAAARPLVHDSIGKAIEASSSFGLSPELTRTVHDAVSAAFIEGMRLAAWVGTVIVIGAAFVAYRFLPARAERAERDDAELEAEARRLASLDERRAHLNPARQESSPCTNDRRSTWAKWPKSCLGL